MNMMSEGQEDALKEVMNIAFSRAGAALSELTGHRVVLDVPKVSVHPIEDLQSALSGLLEEEVATVHQIFSGPVSGDAFLIMNQAGAVSLVDLLTHGEGKKNCLFESDREVLNEVGNILLNACLGTFGNMLKVRITFAVPRVRLDALDSLLDTLSIEDEEVLYALLFSTDFHLQQSDISGFLVFVLGVTSLDLLLKAVDELG